MSSRTKGASSLLIRISLLMGLAVAVLLPAGIWLERVLSDRLIDSRVADMSRYVASGIASSARKVALAEGRVARLAQLIDAATVDVGAEDRAEFDRLTRRAADGSIRLRTGIDTRSNAMIWVPREPAVDDVVRGVIGRSYAVVNQFGAGTVGETADDVWLVLSQGAEIMFAPNDSDYANRPSPVGYKPNVWIDPVRSINNPTGGPRFLPAQRSPHAPVWYAAIVAPVTRDGVLIGATGMEFEIENLLSDLEWLRADSTSALAVVENDLNGVIAYGSGPGFARAVTDSMSLGNLPRPLRDSLSALVARTKRAPPEQVLSGSSGTLTMLAIRMARPNWTFVTLLERATIVAPLRGPLRLTRLGLLAVLAVLLAAILGVAASSIRSQRTVDALRTAAGERFNRLFQMLPVPVALTRFDTGTLVELNDAARRLTGASSDDFAGKSSADIGLWRYPGDRDEVRQMIEQHGFVTDFASTFTDASGNVVDVRIAARRIDVDGKPHILTVVQDLTAQRQLEAKLAQAQKLEAVGRLAGGVAHDFNNLLTAVLSYGELLNASFDERDDRRRDVEEILNAGRRGARLTRQLLGFARQQSTAPRAVNLNDVVRGLEGMLRPLIGTDVEMITELDPTVGTVMIDPGQVEQVITNLVLNARDAMPDGGTLVIRTADSHRSVGLTVTDSGMGISEADRARIFEPFFTTKAMGKGTGLGLATCYGIVNQAGGTIDCVSERSQGTTFRVVLPRLGERAATAPPLQKGATVSTLRGGQRLMVVEDDPMVRGITTSVLESGGYEVVAVEGPSLALAHLLEARQTIDLVISDIVMPRISGPAFGRVLKTTHPDMRILFMSGYTGDELVRHDLSSLGHPFLPKPFTPGELLEAVENALSQAPLIGLTQAERGANTANPVQCMAQDHEEKPQLPRIGSGLSVA